MSELKSLQQLIEKNLQEIHFPSHPESLYEPIRYMLSIGGKRMRPLLVLLSCDLFKGNIEKALGPALAVEVFHNFTLLHDDIMDNAPVRRTKATVHVKWNPYVAILSGDAMFVKSLQLLMKADDKYIRPLMDVFTATALEVCEGQQLDMDFESSDDVSIAHYLKMIELKTAVLLGCSLKMGAIVAGASAADAENIYKTGRDLGIAFQLQDDLLDLYGDEEQFGKMPGGDVVANKKTYLVLKALADGNDRQKQDILYIMNDRNADPALKVNKIKDIFHTLNIRRHTEELMDQYYTKAMTSLHDIPIPDERKQMLITLSESLRVRVT